MVDGDESLVGNGCQSPPMLFKAHDIIKNRRLAAQVHGYFGQVSPLLSESFKIRTLNLRSGFNIILQNGRVVARNQIIDYQSVIYDARNVVYIIKLAFYCILCFAFNFNPIYSRSCVQVIGGRPFMKCCAAGTPVEADFITMTWDLRRLAPFQTAVDLSMR